MSSFGAPRENLWRSVRDAIASPGFNRADAADFLLNDLRVVAPPIPVLQIIEHLGIALHHSSTFEFSGACEVINGRANIWVNNREAAVRRRFTAAHELGHLLLHDASRGAFRDQFSGVAPFTMEEAEANAFAANLLMPAHMVWRLGPSAGYNLRSLAGSFAVSTTAMEYRLRNLGRRG